MPSRYDKNNDQRFKEMLNREWEGLQNALESNKLGLNLHESCSKSADRLNARAKGSVRNKQNTS